MSAEVYKPQRKWWARIIVALFRVLTFLIAVLVSFSIAVGIFALLVYIVRLIW